MKKLLLPCLFLALSACDSPPKSEAESPAPADASRAEAPTAVDANGSNITQQGQRLATVLDQQDEAAKARYHFRHPAQTLEFFGVKPGMTVVEALPGGGWYSRILVPYLGEQGTLIGADYAVDMWPKFGFFDDEFIAKRKTWASDWPTEVAAWPGDDKAMVKAFNLGSLPGEMKGSADVVLFIRALHNLQRFENDGAYLSAALKDAFDVLKPGAILGVVQHQAPPDASEDWADGGHGYLNKDWLIQRISEAGFEFIEASPVNENPLDQPANDDVVWRLPPSFAGSEEGSEDRAALAAIGESNRMTLKFRKPQS